ncbi:stage II sporulation protein M [Paenibacillus woosongensis]|uniref:Stage II sporulation protein M n=1 Tax=Paenibacillus woosongensis TaxID=307580 RepID=A0AA95I3P7_9BACL|nr:stage II sporulation protein M [Paenibacillus woosongensis]WHX49949.1 stage II sporulation protein M [Paenibacillus woosongensis]
MVKKSTLLWIVILVFLLFSLLGFITADVIVIQADKSKLQPVFGEIYFQNLKVALIILFGGIITAGIIPLVILIQNSIMFGVGIKNASYSFENLQYILAHGVLEMPMFVLFTFISLRLTYEIYTSRKNDISIRKLTILSIIAFIGLTLAALIETFITPQL